MRKPERVWRIALSVVFLTTIPGAANSLHAQRSGREDSRGSHDSDYDHGRNADLTVTSFPSGAHVSIDGVDTRKVTPMSVDVRIGQHQVRGTGLRTRLGMECGHFHGAGCFRGQRG